MAQTNFTPISLYYSTTAAAVPTAGNLVPGELAINITDGKLYYEDNAGVVQVIATKATATGPAGSNTQVQFNNSGSFGASSNFTWNGTTLALTGALTATANSVFSSTGALTISKGTTGERPTAVSGMLRFNTTTTEFEGYNGTAWASVGGAALSNDTSTATNVFPLFANATSGTASTLFTSNAKYLYKPSTGDLQASQMIAANGFFVNANTLINSYVLATGYNANSTGPFTIPSGMSVTVSSGARWVVL
jgi:uncharacterized Zn-binding protein involved in type VI secretion